MPPLWAQDPLAAAQRGLEWRWFDVVAAIGEGASDPWVVALLALALYSWLEQEVRDVLAVFLPLAAALAVAAGVEILARTLGGAPRLAGDGWVDAGRVFHAGIPGANVAVAVTVAAYSVLAYGRRAWPSLLLPLVAIGGRVGAGGANVAALAGGGLLGLLLGASAYFAAAGLLPKGHLARLKAGRRGSGRARPDA